METLTNPNPRTSDGVGSCFIRSDRYPQFSYLVALVDLPRPVSPGFEYQFTESYSNNWLMYTYTWDPQADPSDTITVMLPPFFISQDDINSNLVQTIQVIDASHNYPPKTGTVSTIKFSGKWGKLPQMDAAALGTPQNWYVNAFFIQSETKTNQYFLVATCDIMPSLDGYNGPYTNILSQTPGATPLNGGNLQVAPNRPTDGELWEAETTAIYTTEITSLVTPQHSFILSFFTVGVTPLLSSENVSQNYNPQPTTDTPDACI